MKSMLIKYRVPAACLITILLAGVAPAIATAATTTHYRSKGLTADFESYVSSGSVETDVYLDATEGQNGSPSGLVVSVYQYDFTTGTTYASYCGELPLTSSQIQFAGTGNTLQSASLNLTGAVLQDCFTGANATADISIAWTGSGSNFTTRDSYGERFGGEIFHVHSAGTERAATATGSIVINGTDFLAGATSDSEYAYLQKSTYVWVDISRPF